jgi:probable HAF family extracellular repeat protein
MRLITKLFVLCLSLGSGLFATDFHFVRIDVPNSTFTAANGINARGDIVGRYHDVNGVTHGFLRREGVFSTIDFPGASFTAPRAINARGDIVGRMQFEDGNNHGFLLHDGKFTQIDYPGAIATSVRGINNSGDITGARLGTNSERGFILQDGRFKNVRVPHSGTTDVWMAMDNGRVAVGDIFTDADGGIHGYIRNGPGDFQIVDFPGAGSPCSALRWINERGDIVGNYANTLDECYAFQAHGFLLRQGQFTAIDFPGSVYTETFAINDDGQIVGDYTDNNGNTHGFKAVQ